jgi:hypothetical protein
VPRIDPARGQLIAAGAIALTVAVLVTEIRFDTEWSAGGRLALSGLAALVVLAIAVRAPRAPDEPSPWVSAVLVCAFVLIVGALSDLADLLGADDQLSGSGTLTWVGLLVTALFARFAVQRDSAICTLLAAVTGTGTVLAFTDWVFGLDNPLGTFRWLLLVLTVALFAAGVAQLDARPRHAVALIDAAGLAAFGIALTVAVNAFVGLFGAEDSSVGIGWGWELAVLASGAALAAVAVLRRVPGPGYLAALDLFAFGLLTAATNDDASLVGWPIVLFAAAVALLFAALRPPPPVPPDRMEVTVR